MTQDFAHLWNPAEGLKACWRGKWRGRAAGAERPLQPGALAVYVSADGLEASCTG